MISDVILTKRAVQTLLLYLSCSTLAYAYQSISLGAHYLKGDYGEPVETEMWYLPVTLKHRSNKWMAQLTVPYLQLDGPSNVVGGIREPLSTGGGGEAVSEQGLGDVIVKGSYNLLYNAEDQLLIDVLARWKIPSADEQKALGTGQDDYSLQLDLAKRWGAYSGFASVGYKWRGDGEIERETQQAGGTRELASMQLSLDDGAYVSLGGIWHYHAMRQIGLVWDYREPANADNAAIQEAIFYGKWRLDRRWSVMSYLGRGFTRNSSDATVGLQCAYRF